MTYKQKVLTTGLRDEDSLSKMLYRVNCDGPEGEAEPDKGSDNLLSKQLIQFWESPLHGFSPNKEEAHCNKCSDYADSG